MKYSHPFRTRIAKDIVTEFLPPERKSDTAIILCSGLPTSPSKTGTLAFLSRKGYWVFFPRYRGTWESGGKFLKNSPVEDIADVAEHIAAAKEFTDIISGMKFPAKIKKVYVIGASFGGAIALSLSVHRRVDKVIALSPVVDLTDRKGEKPEDWLKMMRLGFGDSHRFSGADWKRLVTGKLFNPVAGPIDPGKVFIIHSKDDRVTDIGAVAKFVKEKKCAWWQLKKQGHLSIGHVSDPRFFAKIERFLKAK